jgi:hypothetical protein
MLLLRRNGKSKPSFVELVEFFTASPNRAIIPRWMSI